MNKPLNPLETATPAVSFRNLLKDLEVTPAAHVITTKRANYETFSVGDSATLTRNVTADDFIRYSAVSGDENPVHWNPDFAAATPFKGVIGQGMFEGGLLSALFGSGLPGPGAIYLEQSLQFKAPIRPGDTLVVSVVLTELLDKGGARFDCKIMSGDTIVMTGQAALKLPRVLSKV